MFNYDLLFHHMTVAAILFGMYLVIRLPIFFLLRSKRRREYYMEEERHSEEISTSVTVRGRKPVETIYK